MNSIERVLSKSEGTKTRAVDKRKIKYVDHMPGMKPRANEFQFRDYNQDVVDQVIALRGENLTYGEIGKKLGRSRQVIYKIIFIHAPHLRGRVINKRERKIIERPCALCGKVMKLTPPRKKKIYCSSDCAWAARKDDIDSYSKALNILKDKYIHKMRWGPISEKYGYDSITAAFGLATRIATAAGYTRKQAAKLKSPTDLYPEWRRDLLANMKDTDTKEK